MTAAIAVGILAATGMYLIFQRGLIRITIGFVMLGHAANIIVVAAGGMSLRSAPLLGHGPVENMADPLPQAFVLTAIVITFGITIYLLALARGGGEDDPGADALDPDAPDKPGGDDEDDVDPARRADLGHGSETPEQDQDVSHLTGDRAGTR